MLYKLLVLFVTATCAKRQVFEPFIRFTSIRCSSSNRSLASYGCSIKAHNRTYTTLNVHGTLKRPLFKASISFFMTYKSLSNAQRPIIPQSNGEICEILNGTVSNRVFNWIMGLAPALKPLVHPCPYKGTVALMNVTANLKMFVSAFPGGTYTTKIKLYDDSDENIYTVRYTQDLISKDRREF